MKEQKSPTMSPEEVAADLRTYGFKTTQERIRAGISQGVYPFGIVIMLGSPVYEIYRKDYEAWKAQHVDGERVG